MPEKKNQTTTTDPSPEDIEKVGKVAQAGAEASGEGGDVAGAMKQERDRVQLDIPDDVLDRMADAISSKNIAALEQRGAFDTPPEPVRPPESAETAPPAADQGAPVAPAADDPPPPAPVKRTWAHKFFGE
jgi:hypothetical protein